MKSITKVLLLVLYIAILPSSSEAQFLSRLKERVSNAVEDAVLNKAEDKAREKTEEAIDGVLESTEKKDKKSNESERRERSTQDDQQAKDFMSAILNRKEAKYSDRYEFDIAMTMEYSDHKKKPQVTDIQFGDKGLLITVGKNTRMLQDFDNQTAINIDEKEKSGQAISMGFLTGLVEKSMDKEIEKGGDFQLKATGRKKTILGHTCEEHIMVNDERKTEAWITNEAIISNADIVKAMTKMFKFKMNHLPKEIQGLSLETITYKNGKLESTTRIRKLEKVKTSINLKEYKITKL